MFGIGWALFGVAALRARVVPRPVAVMILAGGVLSGVPIGLAYQSGGIILGLAVIWSGIWMMRARADASSAVEPASA